MTDTNTMREEFEAWLASRLLPAGMSHPFLERASLTPERYFYGETQEKWVCWQAAKSADAQTIADRQRVLREAADDLSIPSGSTTRIRMFASWLRERAAKTGEV